MPARSSSIQLTQSLAVATPQPNSQHLYNPNETPLEGFGMNGNAFFDFSGPLGFGAWDEAMLLSPSSWPADPTIVAATSHLETVPQPIYQLPFGHQSSGPLVAAGPSTPRTSFRVTAERTAQQTDPASTSPFSHEGNNNSAVDGDLLVNTFLQMLMPPILTPVEIGAFTKMCLRNSNADCTAGPKWASTRAFFGTMAAESPVVRSAIMAFAAMQMQRSGLGSDAVKTDWRPLYDTAARQLSAALAKRRKVEGTETPKSGLKHVLASLFLLTYTDVSEPLQ